MLENWMLQMFANVASLAGWFFMLLILCANVLLSPMLVAFTWTKLNVITTDLSIRGLCLDGDEMVCDGYVAFSVLI